jgi:hypothetical protein
MDNKPCRVWTLVATQASGVIDVAVSTEDLEATPGFAMSVLRNTLNQLATETWSANTRGQGMVADDDAVLPDFPKTTVTINVCLRPVRVLLMPYNMWCPASATTH